MASIDENIMRFIHNEERICNQLAQLELQRGKSFYNYVFAQLCKELEQARMDAQSAFAEAIQVNERHPEKAVLRIMYKRQLAGAVDILDGNAHERRGVPEPNGGVTGVRKHRTISTRTAQLLSYTGASAGFLLRFLNSGTDTRVAHSDVHGRGSMGTWGARKVMPKDSARIGTFERAVRMDSRAAAVASSIERYWKSFKLEQG